MSNALTFILKLQDMLTPGMRQAAQISNSAASKISGDIERVGSSGKKMNASVDELRSRLEGINRVRFSTTIEREFNSSTRAAQRLEAQIMKMNGRGKGGGIMGMLGGFAVGAGVLAMGKKALGAAATREQQNISFEVMTGDKKTGQTMVKDLVNMGAKTPYESADLVKNAQTLKAFGIENQKVIPILNTIGDIASGDAQKLQSLSLAFAQTSSAGKLSGQDLLQMVNAGFNPLQQMLKDKVFPSMMEARKAMEKGAIGANMVEAAFKSATGPGGQFHNMMERQSKTLAGRWSTFMDNATEKLLKFGNILMPVATALLNFGSAMLEVEPWAVALAAGIGILAVAVKWTAIQIGYLNIVASIAAFRTAAWSAVQSVLNAAFWANPITWVIASIIALIAIIGYVIYTTDGWGKQWDSIIKFFKFSWESFKDYFNFMWLNMQNSFLTGIEVITKAWYNLKKLWDEDGAQAGLNKIHQQQNNRATEIAKAKGVLQADVEAAKNALTWELHSNGKTLDTMTADIKKKLGLGTSKGVDPTTANMSSSKADYGKLGGKGLDDAKSKSDGVNAGGQRSIVINIGKQIEKLEVTVMDAKEGVQEIETMVREAMRRAVFSMNGAAS